MKINELMRNSGVRFGTSGARGLVTDITDRVVYAYTLGFLAHLRAILPEMPQRLAIAGDLRTSTPRIVRAICKAVEDFGLIAVDCGRIPTPTLSYYGFSNAIPSIMVTGSHIPEDRNGIKFNLPWGEILKPDEAAISGQTVVIPEELFDRDGMLKPEAGPTKILSDSGAATRLYIARYTKAFPNKVLEGVRIGLYEHSAVGRDLIAELLTLLGASVTPLGRSDVFVAVDTEAVRREDLDRARIWAAGDCAVSGRPCDPVNPPFDVIFSTDGDSDRPLIFDENGDWIRGDLAGVLCARFLDADCVVTPVSSNTALERCAFFAGRRTIRTKIGSPYVVEAMNKAVAEGLARVVGYEANGGFLTATPILLSEEITYPLAALPTRDPVIVLLAVLSLLKQEGVPLSELVGELPRRVALGDRLTDFPPELSQQKLNELLLGGRETIATVFAAFGELTGFDTTDGLRMTFDDTGDIVHLRPSGNAPEFRCYVEADTARHARELLDKALEIVARWRENK